MSADSMSEHQSVVKADDTLALDDLGLAARPYRRLSHHGVTVSGLTCLSAEDLLLYPGLGEGSVRNVEACLVRFGLSLRPPSPKPEPEKRRRAKERGR